MQGVLPATGDLNVLDPIAQALKGGGGLELNRPLFTRSKDDDVDAHSVEGRQTRRMEAPQGSRT